MFVPDHLALQVWIHTYKAPQECQRQKSIRGLPTVSFETIKVREDCLYGEMSHKSLVTQTLLSHYN